MEVWALEAYAASNILQEMITIKSDDVAGRTQAYEAIVKNATIKKPNIPESFNVLIKELQAIGLDIGLLDKAEVEKREGEIASRYQNIIDIESRITISDDDEDEDDGEESNEKESRDTEETEEMDM